MSDYRSVESGKARNSTWEEKARLAELKARGITDVYLEPDAAPGGFWEAILIATHWSLANDTADEVWESWERETRYALGWQEFGWSAATTYEHILTEGQRTARSASGWKPVSTGERLAAIEHLLDVVEERDSTSGTSEFIGAVNDRARHFRIGLRLDGTRFTPLTSEHLHVEIVQPALLLLGDVKFAAADSLYRKAFDRALSGDPAGAVTAATSAVEEMLRAGLGVGGLTLEKLLNRAREAGWIIPAAEQVIVKLAALRASSDAHEAGTDSFDVAMLAIHLSGSVVRFLASTMPR